MPLDESTFSSTLPPSAPVSAPVISSVKTTGTPVVAPKSTGLVESSFSTTAQPAPSSYTAPKAPAQPKSLWDNIWGGVKSTAGNVVNELGGAATSAKNFLTNPQPDNPLLLNNIGKSAYNYEMDLGKSLQPLATEVGREQVTKNVGQSIVDTNTGIADSINKIADTFSKPNQASKQSAFQTISDLANYGLSGINLLLSPINYANNAAEKVPFLKPAADEFNFIFSNLGKVKTPIKGFVKALPDSLFSTPEVKSNFGDSMGNLGSLGAQIIFGGMIMELGGKGEVIDNAKVDELVDKTKAQVEKVQPPIDQNEAKAKIDEITKKYAQQPIEEAPKTAPIEVTNKLIDEGFSKSDQARIVNELYQQYPDAKGDFTQEQIDAVKKIYDPVGKDVPTITSEMESKGASPEEQQQVINNLYAKHPEAEGKFLKADINTEYQSVKGEDLFPTEAAKAASEKVANDAKAQAIADKETAKAQAEVDKTNAKIKAAKDSETQAKTAHDNAINASELAKGKIEDSQKDYEKSQKDQEASQKKLQQASEKEKSARIKLDESKAAIADKQAKGAEKADIMKARASSAKAKVETTRAKVDLENAKDEAKNADARTKSLKAELQKARIEAVKAETVRIKARDKYVEAQKNTQGIKKSALDTKEEIKTVPETKTTIEKKKIETPVEKKIVEEAKKPEGNKVGKSIGEVNAKLAEDGFNKLPEDQQAKYNSSTKQGQIDAVGKLLDDKENFKSISLGDTPIPEDSAAKGPVIWNTARAMAYKEGDFEWFAKLGNSPLGADISEAASNLSLSRFGKSENGAEVAVADNMKQAQDAVKKGNPKGEQAKSDIIKEANDTAKAETEKQSIEDILKEGDCG